MKKFVQHHLYSLQISYMEDTRGQKIFRSRQQGQGARGSTCLFRGICKIRRHCHDLTQELADIVRILDHHLGDDVNEGIDDGLRDGAFVDNISKCTEKEPQSEDTTMVLRQNKGDNSFSRLYANVVFLLRQTGPHCAFLP